VTFKHNCLLENNWNLKWVMNNVHIIGDSVRCEIYCVWNSVNHMCSYSSLYYLAHTKMYLLCFLPTTKDHYWKLKVLWCSACMADMAVKVMCNYWRRDYGCHLYH